MKKSSFFTLNWKDLVKGFVMAILTALITGIYQALQSPGGIQFTWLFFQPIVYTAIAGGLAYLIKNWLTNTDDKFLKPEK